MNDPKTITKIDLAENYKEGNVVFGKGSYCWHTGEVTEKDSGERLTPHISRMLYEDFPQHVYMLARTGGGKTTLLKSMVYQSVRSEKPVSIIIIDGKNSRSFRSDLSEIARSCGKEFLDVSSFKHNPLANSTGNTKDIVERLMDGFLLAEGLSADASYYKSQERRFYDTVIRCFVKHWEKEITFDDLFWASRKQSAENFFPVLFESQKLSEKDKADLRDTYVAIKEKDLSGAVTNLSPLADMWPDEASGTINLYKELINPNSILYFGFNATNPLSEDAKLFRMLLREIMQLIHKKNSDEEAREIQTRIFIDEFGVLKAESVAQAIALARESNTGFIFAHQNFEQLEELQRKTVFKNCFTKIFGQIGEEAKEISEYFGDMWVSERGLSESTDVISYSYSSGRVFKIHPDLFRNLKQFEFCVVTELQARVFYSLLWDKELANNPKFVKLESSVDPTTILKWLFYFVGPIVLLFFGIMLSPDIPHMKKSLGTLGYPEQNFYFVMMILGLVLTIIAGPASKFLGWILCSGVCAFLGAIFPGGIFWGWLLTIVVVRISIHIAEKLWGFMYWVKRRYRNREDKNGTNSVKSEE